ncbi:hypothetical protein B0H34DRAFT_784635 [Crassisporium funariophilum]|nr:hypothetical protein B0H34DRAFT_784635 [Crassisporium funariophilum]
MMETLAEYLNERGVVFDKNGNHACCFPHVTNISAKTGLKHVTKVPEDDAKVEAILTEELFPEFPSSEMDSDYREALESDIVASAQKLVQVLQASGQRRKALRGAIHEGNEKGLLLDEEGACTKLELLELLRDVNTRWSSTLTMIDRLLVDYPAVKLLLERPEHADLAKHLLSDIELTVLGDIREFLNVFHAAQQIVSAEKTPTLSIFIPVFEKLISMFHNLRSHKPNIAHAIDASIGKLEEYMAKARSTKIYAVAMYSPNSPQPANKIPPH